MSIWQLHLHLSFTHACTKLWFQFNLHILSAWSNGWCQGGRLCRVDMGWRCIKRATALRTDRLTPVDDPCSFFPCLFNAACAANTGWGEQVPKQNFQPPETEKLFSRKHPYFLSWQFSVLGRVIGKYWRPVAVGYDSLWLDPKIPTP